MYVCVIIPVHLKHLSFKSLVYLRVLFTKAMGLASKRHHHSELVKEHRNVEVVTLTQSNLVKSQSLTSKFRSWFDKNKFLPEIQFKESYSQYKKLSQRSNHHFPELPNIDL